MSLSTLQAQLAALNSTSSSNPATTTTIGTKQHDDRIGRGLHYSVQQGSHINASNNSHQKKYQPTLLYDTTRIAADIPLSTLQQQYEQAIQQLTSASNHSSDTFPHTLQYLSLQLSSSSSVTTSTTIRQIILIVSSLLSECAVVASPTTDTTATSSQQPQQHEYYLPCLYILEYLLRQYHIHTSSNNAIDLLWCFLPVSQSFPTLLHRCLLLCDWTTNASSYLWLRPYCIETSDTSTGTTNLPSRTLIAISTMKHVDLLRYVCQMVRNIQSLYLQEQQQQQSTEESNDGDDHDDDENAPFVLSTGMSHILSYTAAIIIEGLHYVQKNHSTNNTSLLENIIRIILPTISSMTTSRSSSTSSNTVPEEVVEEFYSWGYIIATTMVETMSSILSTSVINTLSHIMILASCSSGGSDHPYDNHSSNSIRQNGIVCLFSILFPHGRTNHSGWNHNNTMDDSDDTIMSCIPLVVSNMDPKKTDNHQYLKYIGCPSFNTFMYIALLEQTNVEICLPQVLGELLLLETSSSINSKMLVITASFLCAIVATFVHQLSNDNDTNSAPTTVVAMKLIVSLLENANLQQLLWRHGRLNLISSITAFVLHAAAKTHDVPGQMSDEKNDNDISKANDTSLKYQIGRAHV